MDTVYGSNDHEIELRVVKLSEVITDRIDFQRALKTALAKAIGEDFRMELAGVPELALTEGPDGRHGLFCVDGLTRISGAREAGVEELIMRIHHGISWDAAVDLFLNLNRRNQVSQVDRFRAEYVRGFREARAIAKLLAKAEYVVSSIAKPNDRRERIDAVVVLRRLYHQKNENGKLYDRELITKALGLCRMTAQTSRRARVQGDFIGAIHILIRGGEIDEELLKRVLGEKTSREWIRASDTSTSSNSRPARVADTLRKRYRQIHESDRLRHERGVSVEVWETELAES